MEDVHPFLHPDVLPDVVLKSVPQAGRVDVADCAQHRAAENRNAAHTRVALLPIVARHDIDASERLQSAINFSSNYQAFATGLYAPPVVFPPGQTVAGLARN